MTPESEKAVAQSESARSLSMGVTFGVAAVQMAPVACDPERTQRRMEELARETRASFPWVRMLVFPELAPHAIAPFASPRCRSGPKDLAEPIPGPATERFCRLAADLGCWIVPGSLYERTGDAIYNTAIVCSPSGELVARYRKMFPWYPYEQVAYGEEPCVFDVPEAGRFGLLICYDLWFPELARSLAWLGAEVLLHPSLTWTVDRPQEEVLVAATAIFTQSYVVDANGVFPANGGGSVLADPNGRTLLRGGAGEAVLTEVLDLGLVRRVREQGTLGLNRLTQQFREWGMRTRLPPYAPSTVRTSPHHDPAREE